VNIQSQQFKDLKSSSSSIYLFSHFTSNNVDKNNIRLSSHSSISTTSSLPAISSINSASDVNSNFTNSIVFNNDNNFHNNNNVDILKEYITPSTGDNRAQKELTNSGPLHKSNNININEVISKNFNISSFISPLSLEVRADSVPSGVSSEARATTVPSDFQTSDFNLSSLIADKENLMNENFLNYSINKNEDSIKRENKEEVNINKIISERDFIDASSVEFII
jgi:hypothetical protein